MSTTTRGLRYDDVRVGDEIPTLEIPLTRTLIVATAIASRDYQDVHHDPALAHEKGSKDIFMNILTTNGLVGRYITDWAGPNAVLKSVKIRLGAPNYPGDTMRLTGSVLAKADGVVEVGIRGANSLGDHVTGTVALALPDPPIAWTAGGGDGAEPGAAEPGELEGKKGKGKKGKGKKGKGKKGKGKKGKGKKGTEERGASATSSGKGAEK